MEHVKVLILSKTRFVDLLRDKGISESTIATRFSRIAFISILDTEDSLPVFHQEHANLLQLRFDDVEEDIEVPVIGTGKTLAIRAMTQDQAGAIVRFVAAHRDKKIFVVHCTAGVSRSGAVGHFVNEFLGGNRAGFKEMNPNICPNRHVLKLLAKELAGNAGTTEEVEHRGGATCREM